MQKISRLPDNINEIPVVFLKNPSGKVLEKISINELKERVSPLVSEDYRIKLYRNALEHYADQNFENAELLLLHLIETSEGFHYEYYERLASVYEAQEATELQIEVLTFAQEKITEFNGQEALLRRVTRRLVKAQKHQEKKLKRQSQN
ncbi:hypothetical protein [Enterococcus sp. LJL90]